MYGLSGKIIAAPGKRDELITVLLNGTATMPGCRRYVIAEDPDDLNAIWITEVGEQGQSRRFAVAAVCQRGHRQWKTANLPIRRSYCDDASRRDWAAASVNRCTTRARAIPSLALFLAIPLFNVLPYGLDHHFRMEPK